MDAVMSTCAFWAPWHLLHMHSIRGPLLAAEAIGSIISMPPADALLHLSAFVTKHL